jgi:transposase InsO family protein
MLFAFLYSCLRLLLDIADVRLRLHNPEAELLLLRHELRVLRRQINRPELIAADRIVMAAFHRVVSRPALGGLVEPETVLGWHRELVRRKWAAFGRRRVVGRPRLEARLTELILRMARENPRWGCVRIRDELLKVGHRVSATAIRNLLRREKVGPAPQRSALSWRAFLKAQASSIVVSDFFTVDTVFLRRLYVLLYMELATRRIVWFAVTANPDTAWVTQQSRNLVWKLEGSPIRLVIHDHDTKYPGSADAVFRAEGIRVIKTPIEAPRANAHMERQIGSGRRECLDWILILGRRHLERVMREWIEHYNQARPHRSLDLRTPIARSDPIVTKTAVHRRTGLGGLLSEYSGMPAAAAA